VTYVHEAGHTRIAYIHGTDSEVTKNRLASFYRTMEKLDIEVIDEYIVQGEYRNPRLSGEITEKLLKLQNPPTCIFYPDDFSAIGGMNVIKTKGMRIPDDISIVGYDGITIASQLDPKLTTMRQDTESLGGVAAKKLINLIEKPKSTPIEQVIVEAQIERGCSTKQILDDKA
jgi:LacI family transcriptional regulator/LacI family purine nucleotide synthesis repressor